MIGPDSEYFLKALEHGALQLGREQAGTGLQGELYGSIIGLTGRWGRDKSHIPLLKERPLRYIKNTEFYAGREINVATVSGQVWGVAQAREYFPLP